MSERIIVVTGVSGAGKSSIAEELARRIGKARKVINCTTRTPRPGEVDGIHYRFLDKADFLRRLSCGEFAENARYPKTGEKFEMYGTLREDLDRQLNIGEVAILTLDIQGAEAIARKYPGAQILFITAPLDQLMGRLERRDDTEESRSRRQEGLVAELLDEEHPCVQFVIRNIDGHFKETAQYVFGIVAFRIYS